MMTFRRSLCTLILLITAVAAFAQWEDEYRMEIGGGVGMMSYEGDYNGSITSNMEPMGSVLLRRVFNPYMALAATASYGKLKGSLRDVATYYPEQQNLPVSFSNQLADLGVRYEYNFWPYGTGLDYRGAKRLTPFVFIGLGVSYADTSDGSVFAGNLPIGAGIKYKMGARLNLGVEWAMHFSTSDKLDGVVDPYGIKSTGLFKNRDCFSALQLTLTYSFMAKCKTCNNDKDD